jgi:putative DNA primase/helicase
MKLNPVFDDLNNPATILNHVEELKSKSEATPHAEILNQLIEQFEPLDFEVLAFPHVEKLREKLEQLPVDSEQAKDIRKAVR